MYSVLRYTSTTFKGIWNSLAAYSTPSEQVLLSIGSMISNYSFNLEMIEEESKDFRHVGFMFQVK
jgi:hypothetical protein